MVKNSVSDPFPPESSDQFTPERKENCSGSSLRIPELRSKFEIEVDNVCSFEAWNQSIQFLA